MFETFHTPGFYVGVQCILATYSSGRTTAVTLDIGEGVSQVVPIYDGSILTHAAQRIHLAGQDVTDYLSRLLKENTSYFIDAEKATVEDIKVKHSYAALNYEEQMKAIRSQTKQKEAYTLPDGEMIALGDETFRCTECLFQPSLAGK